MDLVNIALQVLAGGFLLLVGLVVMRFIYAFCTAVWHVTGYQHFWKPKIGDTCYYRNIAGGRTEMTVKAIDGDKLHCFYWSSCSKWDRWYTKQDVMRA